jgi:hypothetical protein
MGLSGPPTPMCVPFLEWALVPGLEYGLSSTSGLLFLTSELWTNLVPAHLVGARVAGRRQGMGL